LGQLRLELEVEERISDTVVVILKLSKNIPLKITAEVRYFIKLSSSLNKEACIISD
jgi:hypothetical protein